jgi:ferredoxin-type protein NapF
MDRKELFSTFRAPFNRDKTNDEIIIRPPYFNHLSDFDKCMTCEDKWCIGACEENIIDVDKDGIPTLSFASSGCTYCDECAIDCDQDVLKVEYKQNIQASIKIDILKCMSWNQTMCFSCKDPCLDNAIEFIGMFRPEINLNQCTMCGFCVKYCPSDAITITQIKKEDNEND